MRRWQRARRGVIGYILALTLVAVVTVALAGIREGSGVGNISMVYLLAVLASAVAFGRGPAITAAIASFLAFNFFFVQPHYTFRVADDEEWVALALLLLTGVVTAQLAALLRERVTDAEGREKEAIVLYDVVSLMADPDLGRAFTAVATRLRSELGLSGVLITFGVDGRELEEAASGDPAALQLARDSLSLPERILGGGLHATAVTTAAPGRWIRVVAPGPARQRGVAGNRVSSVPFAADGRRVGTLVLVRDADAPPFSRVDDRLLSAVASQLSQAVQRLALQREANEAEVLRRADEVRAALLNAVSHDLRTPLSTIIASAGSLRQTDVEWTDEQEREFIESILSEAERLNRFVGNLLDLSRIESGSIRPDKGWYDLASLAEEVVNRASRLAPEHQVRLDLSPEEMQPIHIDYVEIEQALTNLVENAIKHTPAGTTIRVTVREQADAVEVAVEDSGPGIAADDLPQLFKPFFRGAAGARGNGSGLGLAIARGLVEAHGGRIWAENRPDGGAKFAFALPLESRPAAAA